MYFISWHEPGVISFIWCSEGLGHSHLYLVESKYTVPSSSAAFFPSKRLLKWNCCESFFSHLCHFQFLAQRQLYCNRSRLVYGVWPGRSRYHKMGNSVLFSFWCLWILGTFGYEKRAYLFCWIQRYSTRATLVSMCLWEVWMVIQLIVARLRYVTSYQQLDLEAKRLTEAGLSHMCDIQNKVAVNSDLGLFVDVCTGFNQPPQCRVYRLHFDSNDSNKCPVALPIALVSSTPLGDPPNFPVEVLPELFTYTSSTTGFDHYGILFRTPKALAGGQHPTIVYVYGGPNVQIVRNIYYG